MRTQIFYPMLATWLNKTGVFLLELFALFTATAVRAEVNYDFSGSYWTQGFFGNPPVENPAFKFTYTSANLINPRGNRANTFFNAVEIPPSQLTSCSVSDADFYASSTCNGIIFALDQPYSNAINSLENVDLLLFGSRAASRDGQSFAAFRFSPGVFSRPGTYLTVTPPMQGLTGSLSVRVSSVPEPATWAMMLFGFGLVGSILRRRSPQTSLATLG